MRSFLFLAALCSGVAVPASADSWLIRADKIYTAPNAKPLVDGAVVIIGDRIQIVADQATRYRVPDGTRTSDCRGVITAGFQNSHVHFTEAVWAGAAQRPAAELEKSLEAMFTRYGFTTVFDVASDRQNTLALRKRVDQGEVRGPRIFTVGLPLFPPDGIPSYINDLPAEFLARLPQPATVEQARAAVRTNLDAGADGTKLFLHTSPRQGEVRKMSLDIARAAVEETHARGKLVFAHPTSLEAVRVALDAGVDILVHTTLGEPAPWDAATLARMKAAKMSLMPTFKLWIYELNKESVPAPVVDRLVGATLDELRAFNGVRGRVLFGTDVGYMHDYDPTQEYELMAKAGMNAMQILAALTTAPAERFKADKRGRVAVGMDADLVVLAADPADDVRNFAKVRCAFRAGQLIYKAPAP